MLVRVIGATVMAGGMAALPLGFPRVRAAETEDSSTSPPSDVDKTKVQTPPEKPSPPAKVSPDVGRRVPVHQLPIYGGPPGAVLVFVPEKEDSVREYMSAVRQVVWKQLETFDSTWSVVKEKYFTAKQHTKDLGRYLQEDAGALPRAAFITVSGLGGIVAGYKGGVFRKTFYASGGMLAAASVCYPEQAVDLSRRGWVLTKEQAKQLWQQNSPSNTSAEKSTPAASEPTITEKEAAPDTDKKEAEDKKETKDQVKVADSKQTAQKGAPKEDHGMSKAEDKSMYSTRTS